MAKYYPKSQIKTNLYTNGGEYYLVSNQQPYKGYYYVISGNSYLTGKTPEEGKNQALTKTPPPTPEDTDGVFSSNQIIVQRKSYESMDVGNIRNNQIYSITPKRSISSNRNIPTPSLPLPTSRNYKEGEFQRYFCRKTNELFYFEISQKTFSDLQNKRSTIAFDLYIPLSIPWSLTGNKEQVFATNKNIVTLKEKNENFYGFISYFKNNWLKYYQDSTQENLYTSGGEYSTKNGKEYIGDYHIHPEKGPMVGAIHVTTPHEYLYPIMQNTGSIIQPQSTPIIGGGGY
jgi:hypothetical protein